MTKKAFAAPVLTEENTVAEATLVSGQYPSSSGCARQIC